MGLFFYILIILKYIAIAILIILAIFLLLTIVALFSPVKYNLNINKNQQLSGSVEITWFLSIIRFLYSYENKKQIISLNIFKMQIIGGNKKEKNRKSDSEVNITEYNKEVEKEKETTTEIKSELKKDDPEEHLYNEKFRYSEEINTKSKKPRKKIKPKKAKKIKSSNNVKYNNKSKELYDKINFINNYPDKAQIINNIKHLINKIYLSIRPKYIKICGEVGFNEPDLTGKFLAFESVFIALMGLKDVCIKGNFHKKTFLIDGQIKGKFNIMSIVWPMINFILSKPIWKIIKKVIKRKGVLKNE